MAHSRFIKDTGLTARMTLVMFLLGALFVSLIVVLMGVFAQSSPGIAVLIGVAGLGVAWWQWYSSDKLAMRAMRAREVTPEQAPELHGMIDRLCALADMPKPRVGIADMAIPNAFATGRSPDRSVVCVITRTSRWATCESSCASTASSSSASSLPRIPVVTQTTARFGERPVAKALGMSTSEMPTRGFGMSASAQSRSIMPCSSGASSGVTWRARMARMATLSEAHHW